MFSLHVHQRRKYDLSMKTMTTNSLQERSFLVNQSLLMANKIFFIDKIVDKRKRVKKTLYRVRWQGEGPEGDIWLPADELTDCEALDKWLSRRATNFISYVNSLVPSGSFSPTGF